MVGDWLSLPSLSLLDSYIVVHISGACAAGRDELHSSLQISRLLSHLILNLMPPVRITLCARSVVLRARILTMLKSKDSICKIQLSRMSERCNKRHREERPTAQDESCFFREAKRGELDEYRMCEFIEPAVYHPEETHVEQG